MLSFAPASPSQAPAPVRVVILRVVAKGPEEHSLGRLSDDIAHSKELVSPLLTALVTGGWEAAKEILTERII